MHFCVGLTGGIGSGKTSVSRLFAGLGAGIVDTDVISHTLTAAHGAAMGLIESAFGTNFIQADGALDRSAMRALVFADSAAKSRLENLLHPMIHAQARIAVEQSAAPYTILVAPLLLETGSYRDIIHRVLVVDCDEDLQIARSMERSGLDETQVRAIMASQLSRNARRAGAQDILLNDGSLDDLCEPVRRLHQAYLAEANQSD